MSVITKFNSPVFRELDVFAKAQNFGHYMSFSSVVRMAVGISASTGFFHQIRFVGNVDMMKAIVAISSAEIGKP
jgi:hypothetical protein